MRENLSNYVGSCDHDHDNRKNYRNDSQLFVALVLKKNKQNSQILITVSGNVH